jgi:hypothetical protein
MILLIIFAVVGLLISYFYAKENWPFNWGDFIGGIVVTVFLYLLVLGLTRILITDLPKYYTYEYKDQEIQSLINKSGVSASGSFILGCGSISGRSYDYYISYAQFPQGALRIKVSAFQAYIKETNSESPKIKNYWIRKVHKGYNSPWIWSRKEKAGEWTENDRYYGGKEIIVIVPENTIYREFKIED